MNDQSPMPFGKHKGIPLQDVPTSYFHWLWHDGGVRVDKTHVLHNYIIDSISALKEETPNLIWDR